MSYISPDRSLARTLQDIVLFWEATSTSSLQGKAQGRGHSLMSEGQGPLALPQGLCLEGPWRQSPL